MAPRLAGDENALQCPAAVLGCFGSSQATGWLPECALSNAEYVGANRATAALGYESAYPTLKAAVEGGDRSLRKGFVARAGKSTASRQVNHTIRSDQEARDRLE